MSSMPRGSQVQKDNSLSAALRLWEIEYKLIQSDLSVSARLRCTLYFNCDNSAGEERSQSLRTVRDLIENGIGRNP
jgi:hypothetical protein